MTELTVLDWITLGIFVFLIVGLGQLCLEYLNREDRERNRGNQCPPHEWAPYYADDPAGGYKFMGLRCGKCKRTPGGMSSGGGTWPLFPAV